MSRRNLAGLVVVVATVPAMLLSQGRPARHNPAAPATAVTFAETIAPIVYANCVTCHRPGEAAPFSLLTYEDVAKRGALISEVTTSRFMPPWHAVRGYGEFLGERGLTDAQIAAIRAWVDTGMPRGDETRMPRPPAFPPDGWRLGEPDLILEMPAAFEIPAAGPDVFRNFVIPTRLTEDKWVRGVEFRPSARKVVHHALFAQVPGGSLSARDGADGRPGFGGMGAAGVGGNRQESGGLGGWAVGATPRMLPDGLAMRLPKGADFLLQMHFHPTGKVEKEKSLIGIYFADKAPDRDVFSVQLPPLFGFGAGIDIPPGDKSYTIRDSFTVPGDVRVYSAMAHAHYLAREMKGTATLPDGSTRPLIWINDWDFNWQDSYVYKEPFILPKGTRIDVTITYDNSAENPRNPVSPPRRALWGEQSFDEMGTVGFVFEVLHKDDVPGVRQTLADRGKAAIAAGSQDGTLSRFLARQQWQRRGLAQLTVFDRTGAVVSRVGEPGMYTQAAFSPDGSRLAVIKKDPDSDSQDVWTFDVSTGKGKAISADAAPDAAPVWSPDGTQIAYVSVRENTHGIYRRASDGTGVEEQLYQHNTGAPIVLTDWSADGRLLCFWSRDEMFVLPLTGPPTAIALNAEEFFGRGGRLSPDGAFLAFNSNRSGRFEIYVRSLAIGSAGPPTSGSSAAERAIQISTEGGLGGIFWRRDGKELFYLSQPPDQTVMAVEITRSGTLKTGAPRPLFAVPAAVVSPAQLSAIASADGQRFVFAVNIRPPAADSTRQ